MKTTFDIKRFMSFMKYEFMGESKRWIRGMIGFSIALACVYVINLYIKKDALMDCVMGHVKFEEWSYDPFYWFYNNLAGMTLFVWIGMTFAAACNIFKNMGTKQQRISFLALPASNLEKYLARLIWVNGSYLVTFIVGFAVADACLALASLSFGLGVQGSVMATFFGTIGEDNGATLNVNGVPMPIYYLWIGIISLLLFIHSSWTFFGTLFRKNAWLWTMGVCVVVIVLLVKLEEINDDKLQYMLDNWGVHTTYWLNVSLLLCCAFLLYFSAYRLFKGMQVINNKWVNL